MSYTDSDIDRMINEVLDNYKENSDMPYVRGMLQSTFGRKRIFETVKKMALEQGMADIEASLAQIEEAHDWNY
jgi:hypothetical protein